MPGWTSTVVPIYFLGGVQLLCIGVIGEYLAKIYLEVKGRPRFVIERVVGDQTSTHQERRAGREPSTAHAVGSGKAAAPVPADGQRTDLAA